MTTTVSKRIRGLRTDQEVTTINSAAASARLPLAWRWGYREILINEVSADARVYLVPAIRQFWFYDASATVGSRWVNLLTDERVLDGNRTAGEVRVGGGVAGDDPDSWYIGFAGVTKGFRAVFGTANATDVGGAATGSYLQHGTLFASSAISDGTDTGTGVTFGQTGNFTFDTTPTDWGAGRLDKVLGKDSPPNPYNTEALFWMKVDIDGSAGDVDAATAFTDIIPIAGVDANPGTVTVAGNALHMNAGVEYTIPVHSPREIGAIEFYSGGAAGTAQVTWIKK